MNLKFSIKFIFTWACMVCTLSSTYSSRILGLFFTHSKSHVIIHTAIAEALAERGHNVTVVSTFKPFKKNPPYRHIYLDFPPLPAEVFSDAIKSKPTYHQAAIDFMKVISELSKKCLHHPRMQELMKYESFDLVVLGYFLNDFVLGVAAHFKCPVVLSFTMKPFPNIDDMMGNPKEYAYMPGFGTSTRQPIGFLDKISNFINLFVGKELFYNLNLRWYQELYYSEHFPSDKYPSLEEMKKNVSLVLTAHHFSLGPIRPNVPAIVEIGGIQIKQKPDPLPEDIRLILDNSTQNGVIYFSLGTNIYGDHLDPSKINAIFNALSRLPQTILCKWSDPKLPSESPNIFYKNWLPQDDVLHHPNVRLFITHGGMGGINEAQFHGVPMVGISLVNDQHMNMEIVQNSGFGLGLNYETLTEETLYNAIKEVWTNQTYTNNVRRFSRIYRDRPMSAKETAIFWIEYVLRHHGARHIQSPAVHLNFLQLMSLDVMAFLAVVVFLAFKVIQKVCLRIRRMFVKDKPKCE